MTKQLPVSLSKEAAYTARLNISSIKRVPSGLLPLYIKRALIERVEAGEEIYAYQPAGYTFRWNLWIGRERRDIEDWKLGWYKDQHTGL